MAIFWFVAPCRVIAQMTEEVRTSETLVNLYQSTWRYNPEGSHLLWFYLASSTRLHSGTYQKTRIEVCTQCRFYLNQNQGHWVLFKTVCTNLAASGLHTRTTNSCTAS
jgi:hypothetical protein